MKIIIVIEGVDRVVDFKGNFINTSFWLPYATFKNIKMILTASKKSPLEESFKNFVSKEIQFVLQTDKVSKFREKLENSELRLRKIEKNAHIADLKIIFNLLKNTPKLELKG